MNHCQEDLFVEPADCLRQMIAVLERERQALAQLDADDLFEIAHAKASLCDALAAREEETINQEAKALAQTAYQLNEVNRRVRNLLAANIAARIEALGGQRRDTYLASFAQA